MVKKGVKRKLCDGGDQVELSRGARKKLSVRNKVGETFQNGEDSEQAVKEFIKLVNMKETRLKGLTKFLNTLKEAQKSKGQIIMKYLQNHQECLELFQVLDERMEERSLLEVQLVLELLESIILLLAEEDIRVRSKSSIIIEKLFTQYRKLVYSFLNSKSPTKVTTAMLKLLAAIVMQGPSVAKELLSTFDFSHKTFGTLVNRRDKKDIADVRTCFIKFLLSFFISGDPSLIQQVLQIRGFATSIFENLHQDSPEVIHLVLSTLLVQVVQNSSVLKKTKILLFTSYTMTQLVRLYSYDHDPLVDQDMSVRDRVHNFLLELCTSKCGIAFENKLGMFSDRSNNPVLLRFLHSLPKTLGDDLLVELVIKILIHSQDLITPYLLDCQMALEPRNSQQWSKNFLFLIKLYFLLPLPSSTLDSLSATSDCSISKFLSLVSPVTIKRNILTRGLLHSDVLVQTTTLSMVLIILRRSIDLMRCSKLDLKLLETFREDILKILPSLQTLISIKENLLSRTKKTVEVRPHGNHAGSATCISTENAKLLLSRTLASMNLFQILSPSSFIQAGYDPWKLLPRDEEEEMLYTDCSKQSMLRVLLDYPTWNLKWNLQGKGEVFPGFYKILELYCYAKNPSVQNLAKEIVKKLLHDTGVFEENKEEVLIWLRNLQDVCVEKSESALKFFESVYRHLASNPYGLVDAVIGSLNVGTSAEGYRPVLFTSVSRSTLPFSPFVAGALKLLAHMIKNGENYEEEMNGDIGFVARFLNLVLLDILPSQVDPRPLCDIITKYLVKDDLVSSSLPPQTKALFRYMGQWSPAMKANSLDDDLPGSPSKNVKNLAKKQDLETPEEPDKVLSLTSKQFEAHLSSLLRSGIAAERNDGISVLVTYLKFNPVSLFDCLNSSDFAMALNVLPTSLVLQQLLMFVLKYWESGTEIDDTVALRDTFENLSTALLSSVKHKGIECWDQTVSGCLFLASNLIEVYLTNSRNKRIFVEIMRTIVKVVRIVFQRISENKRTNCSPSSSTQVISNDSVEDHGNVDVIYAIDGVSQSTEGIWNNEDTSPKCLKMVFGHPVFKDWFCVRVGQQKLEIQRAVDYVSSVVSNSVAELMRNLQKEILDDKDHEFWKPYFLQIAYEIKQEASKEQITDMVLPFSVQVTSLLKQFCDRFSAVSLSEIILAFLNLPREDFMADNSVDMSTETEEKDHNLSEKGEVLVTLLECFLSKAKSCSEISMSPEVLERVFHLLTWLNCQETDELVTKFITNFSSVSEQLSISFLFTCLDHPTPARVDTAVILLTDRPSLVDQFEQLFVKFSKNRLKERYAEGKNEARFLEADSQWSVCLPLINFYISSVTRGDVTSPSKRTRRCLEYIGQVLWPRFKEWLLSTKPEKHAHVYSQSMLRLLEVQKSENEALKKLFEDVTKRKHSLSWDLYKVQTVESLWQSILKHKSNKKDRKTFNAVFLFACMERLIKLLKGRRPQVDESLRLRILCYLEQYGKGPLKIRTNDNFTSEEFMNVTNMFIKSALRFSFTCGQTLVVLSVIVKTVYQCGSKKAALLMPLTDLFQFILSHSKFLETFLGNRENAKQTGAKVKCALIDLLQTVVDLEPECCNPSHLYIFLGAYGAKLSIADQKVLRLLFTYEATIGELPIRSRVLWGETALETYETNKECSATLWRQLSIVQILDLLEPKLLLQSAKHFPLHKQLQPVVYTEEGMDCQLYDPSFLLPLFSFFMSPGYEVDCRRFIDRAGLAYTFCALTSVDQQMRQVAYQILSRFSVHLSASRFKEKQQVAHLLHCFQNGIIEANTRVSSLVTLFITRALHIFFYPEDPLYVNVNSFMLQKAFVDLREVPLFLTLINSSDLSYRTERTWLLHLLLDGLRDPIDYYICKKYHVFQQLFSLYSCSTADKHLQTLILKVLRQVCRLPAPVYDLCHNYGLIPWLHLLVTNHSTSQEAFLLVLEILGVLWFTLVGREVPRDDKVSSCTVHDDVSQHDESKSHSHPVPKNACSELVMVCLSILQKSSSLKVWNQDSFIPFTRLFASLLDYQDSISVPANVAITNHQAVQITRIWHSIFGGIDVVGKLVALLNCDSSFTSKRPELTSERWFQCMKSVIQILNSTKPQEVSETKESSLSLNLHVCWTRPVGKCIEMVLEKKLSCALRVFLEPGSLQGNHKDCYDWESLRTLGDLIF